MNCILCGLYSDSILGHLILCAQGYKTRAEHVEGIIEKCVGHVESGAVMIRSGLVPAMKAEVEGDFAALGSLTRRASSKPPKIIKEWPQRPSVIVRKGQFEPEFKLPACLNCGQDELYVDPQSGRIGCYICNPA